MVLKVKKLKLENNLRKKNTLTEVFEANSFFEILPGNL